MNLDTYLDAAEGCSSMKDFKKRLGMEGEKSSEVLNCILLGCVADRLKSIEHPSEFYADYAFRHGGELGRKAELLSSALSDLEEAFRD